MSRRIEPTCNHFCNTVACPTCVRRFYEWAQSWTHGNPEREGPHFYEAAARNNPHNPANKGDKSCST
jgi:hypothetical protein